MTLVMDLDTLQGEVDRFALLDGQPIPAGLARDLAEGAKLWRRAVTDPVTGVLLDYGTEQYLPETLRRYVKARDGVCGTPICARTSRLEMDHAEPFPAGTTSAPATATPGARPATSSRPNDDCASPTPSPTDQPR